MHPHRVDVLDRAHDDDIVAPVAHHLELELLPAEDAALDQRGVHGRELKRPPHELLELRAVVGDAAARPAQRERRADHRGIADLGRGAEPCSDRRDRPPVGDSEADAPHRGRELGPVLGHLNRAGVRADQLHPETLQRPVARQRHRHIERRLTAHRRQQRVGPLALDHAAHPVGVHRLDVGPVGELGVGHDRRRVRVHQHDRVTLFLEGFHRLGAGVVELGRLPDHDRARAKQQHAVEVSPSGHRLRPAECRRASGAAPSRWRPGAWRRPRRDGGCPRRAPGRGRPPGSAARRRAP